MALANLKVPSKVIAQLKEITGEVTGQKALDIAIDAFVKQSKRKNILKVLDKISFTEGFDPLKLRKNER